MVKHLVLMIFICLFQKKLVGQAITSDTNFISRNISGGVYQAVFIENNQNSIYYNWICDFSFDDSILKIEIEESKLKLIQEL